MCNQINSERNSTKFLDHMVKRFQLVERKYVMCTLMNIPLGNLHEIQNRTLKIDPILQYYQLL